jgi:uncharacterized protein
MDSSPQPSAATRPDPIVTADAAFFWEGAKCGELLAQRCASCGDLQHPPRPMCPRCHSVDRELVRLSGRGKVDSWIIPRHPPALGFAQPPIVALIRLEEGIRLVSNLVGFADGQVAIGLEVEVQFDLTIGGFAVPVFRPRTG